jgi:outer membrane protein
MIARIFTVAVGFLAASTAMAAGTDAGSDNDYLSNSVRLGAYYVHYLTHADDISGPFVPSGVNLRLKDVVTPYFGYVRSLDSHFQVELTLGVPPLTKTIGKGPAALGSVPYDGQEIVSARWLAPTVLFEYSFLSADSPIRPFIGVGINYVNFYDRNSTAAGNAASGGPTSISLTSSIGPAATAGVDWRLTHHFHLYASFSASEVNTRLTALTAGVVRTSNIEFVPHAVVVSAGYSF